MTNQTDSSTNRGALSQTIERGRASVSAEARQFPGQRRKRGTNFGLCNDVGNWLHIGPNIAAFNTAKAARNWLADPAGQGKDQALTFRYVHVDALTQ